MQSRSVLKELWRRWLSNSDGAGLNIRYRYELEAEFNF